MTGWKSSLFRIDSSQRDRLQQLLRCRSTPQNLARRCRIILALADGWPATDVAAQQGVARLTVLLWRDRFQAAGVPGLLDETRSGAPRVISDSVVQRIVSRTCALTSDRGTRLSTRSVARDTGISQSTVSRVWRAFQITRDNPIPFRLMHRRKDTRHILDLIGLCVSAKGAVLVIAGTRNAWHGPRTAPVPEPSNPASPHTPPAGVEAFASLFSSRRRPVDGPDGPPHQLVPFLNECESNVRHQGMTMHAVFDRYSLRTASTIVRWHAGVPHVRCHLPLSIDDWRLQVIDLVTLLAVGDHPRHEIRRSAQSLLAAASRHSNTGNGATFEWRNRLVAGLAEDHGPALDLGLVNISDVLPSGRSTTPCPASAST